MEISFTSHKLREQMSSASKIKKAFGEKAKKINQRLEEFKAASNLNVLSQIPAARCHQLKGNHRDEWAVNISVNFRMIFQLDHDPIPRNENGDIIMAEIKCIKIIEVTDYH